MTKDLIAYCKEHGYESPKFWPLSCTRDYAMSVRMRGNDLWEDFEANVLFIIGEHRNNEAKLLGQILKELQEPVVLTVPLADSVNLLSLYKSLGFTLMPGRWTDKNEREYEVYVKGQMNMGGYVNLMERVERIGSCAVAIRRPLPVVLFSFLSFKFSQVFG